MLNWGVADWVTYPPIIVAALIMAMIQAAKDIPTVPEWVPKFLKNARWNYAPILLLMVSATAWGIQQFIPMHKEPRTITKLVTKYVPQKIYVPQRILVPTADPAQVKTIVDLQAQVTMLQRKLREKRSIQTLPSNPQPTNPATTMPPIQGPNAIAAPTPPSTPTQRRLSVDDKQTIINNSGGLRGLPPGSFRIESTQDNFETIVLSDDFMDAFGRAGTKPSEGQWLPDNPDETGIMVGASDPNNPTNLEKTLHTVLTKIGINAPYIKKQRNDVNLLPLYIGPLPLR